MTTDRNFMLYLSCSQCGLLNIPERRTCKRCQAVLDPTAQVRLPAPKSQRATLPRGCMFVFFGFWGFMFILFAIRVVNPPPPTIPTPGSTIYFRGDSIALLRMVTQPPYEGIEVHRDGRAFRFRYSTDVRSSSTHIRLTSTELEALQQLRRQWCQQLPTFRTLAPREPFYDLAFECGGYTAKQAKVPVEMVPSIFETLLQRLPRPVL